MIECKKSNSIRELKKYDTIHFQMKEAILRKKYQNQAYFFKDIVLRDQASLS